jgi:hypothetical protein
MKFIKLFENFQNDYTLDDVFFDVYEINYILDEQNISANYSFAIYSDLNSNLVTHQIGTTDPENSEVLINKIEQFNLKDLLKKKFEIGDMITISFFDNNVNRYLQVEDINDDNRDKFNSYCNLLKDHLEPFDGLSIEMRPHKLYKASAPMLTIIIKKIK